MDTTVVPQRISFRSMAGWKAFFKELARGFSGHDLMTLAAALAFYTALSLAPLLVILLSVIGLMGENSQDQLVQQIQGLMGSQASEAVRGIIESADKRPTAGSIAGVLSVLALLFSASGVFAQLQASLNVIWEAQGKAAKGAWGWIRKRLLSMGMVITLGFLAMVSLLTSTILSFFFQGDGGALISIVNTLVSIAVFSFIFALVHKYLPDADLTWKNAFVGGTVTAVLFTIGKSLIGLYLGKSAVGSSYGAAGSLVVLLAWVYYSGVIVFTGAEITRILAARAGERDALEATPADEPGAPRPHSMKPSYS